MTKPRRPPPGMDSVFDRLVLWVMAVAIILILVFLAAPPTCAQNVLLVIADDVGVADQAAVETPTMDALAANGVTFTAAWSHPSCSPTRLALLSGQPAYVTGCGGVVQWGNVYEPSTALQLATELAPTAGWFGKWHLSNKYLDPGSDPVTWGGLDVYAGSLQGSLAGGQGGGYYDWVKTVSFPGSGSSQHQTTTYATTATVDDALAWLGAQGTGPWLCVVSFNAAHHPWHDPPGGLVSLPPGGSPQEQYRAAIQAMDAELGRLLNGLTWRQAQDTAVVYFGDNGAPAAVSTHPAGHAKGTVYQGGVHVPLVIASADIICPGRSVTDPVADVDLFPTVLELMGLQVVPSSGQSLLPYLLDPAHDPRPLTAYTERFLPNGPGPYTEYDWAITDGRWKLLEAGGVTEFYDLSIDPDEQTNLLPTLDPEQMAAYEFLEGELP